MMKRKICILLMAALLVGQTVSGCGKTQEQKASEEESISQEMDKETDGKDTETEGNSKVASADEMAKPEELDMDGLKEISGEQVKDGVYPITVDSTSSMFQIEKCELTVKDQKMSAVMTMGGAGYLRVYMGTGEEAAKAPEEDCISYEENAVGQHTFTVPVEALNKQLDCAAFSKKKEQWYERKLVFRADSLPIEALAEGVVTTPAALSLEEGEYTVEVALKGGSGKAGVESPAVMRVENGKVYASIVWSSSNYDYMKVDDVKYELAGTEGNSRFEIPVKAFDWALPVIADTVAMSEPHEIEYALYFDSSSIQKAE